MFNFIKKQIGNIKNRGPKESKFQVSLDTFYKEGKKRYKIPLLQEIKKTIESKIITPENKYRIDHKTNLKRIEREISRRDDLIELMDSATFVKTIRVHESYFRVETDTYTIQCLYHEDYKRQYIIFDYRQSYKDGTLPFHVYNEVLLGRKSGRAYHYDEDEIDKETNAKNNVKFIDRNSTEYPNS